MSTNQATAILYTICSSSAKAKIQVCLTYEFKCTTLKCWMLKLTLLDAVFNLRHSKPIKSSRALFDTLPTYTTSASNLLGSTEQDLLRAKFDSPHPVPFANFPRALGSLILEVRKKATESRRAARMNSDDEEERSGAGPSGTQPESVVRPPPTIYAEKPFKIIYIQTTAAPQGTACSLPWIVSVGGVANQNWLGVLKHYTVQELGKAIVSIHADIQPVNTTPDGTHQVELIDDDQVNAWVRLSNARPLMVACVLHCAPAPPPDGPPDAPLVRPNTPLARNGDRYLEPGQFDVAEFYTEPASDSEREDDLAHRTMCRKGFPGSDGGWRRRIQTNDWRVLRFLNYSRARPSSIQISISAWSFVTHLHHLGEGKRVKNVYDSLSVDVDFPSQQDEQEVNLFASDDATDIDEDSDEAPQRHRRVQKRSVEDYSQHQQRAKRLRFLTADSPSPALTGPTSVVSSQSQQVQIHSGHLRINSPHFTSSILGSQLILMNQNGCQMAEEANNWSNFIRGEERIVFENAANMVRYHTWFVNPFVKLSENNSPLESYWVKAVSKLGWPGLAMQKHAMTFRLELRCRTFMTFYTSNRHKFEQRLAIYWRMIALRVIQAIRRATWQRLPVVVQKKLVEDTMRRRKRLLCHNGFVPEQESRAALDDLDTALYLRVQVSGDEESEVEDNNSDPEAEDVIDTLVEGPEEDE
ncbi:hypothetical protein HOY80DRAFT_1113339 [Tuber brumale]|nr:hypothetical protein HOY80DRAFT_1113339 [Tuber brumale]